ncbi:MAG: LITAF-like zinc ribbon domain-containing protein [Promethearchaeota archaeon]|nr:MAG: LITAF-like zinc ribbon domain-containing protein [Candidatus Lokiarchaeota archaeon]
MGLKVYCPTCEEIVTLRRKNFDHVYHEILCFMVILTLGLGFIIYFILKYSKKPNTCPNCESIFDLNNLSKQNINLNHTIKSKTKFILP